MRRALMTDVPGRVRQVRSACGAPTRRRRPAGFAAIRREMRYNPSMGADFDGIKTTDVSAAPAMATDLPPEVGYCWQCGYDLRGLERGVCPECGFRFDLEAVRALNEEWCAQRVLAFRGAQVLGAAACALTLTCMLTGSAARDVLMFGIWGTALLVIGMIARVGQWFFDSLSHGDQPAPADALTASRVLMLIGACLMVVPLLGAGWIVGAGAFLAAGIVTNLIQLNHYADGRRRGRLVGVSESLLESLRFAVGAAKFVMVLSGVLLVAAGVAW